MMDQVSESTEPKQAPSEHPGPNSQSRNYENGNQGCANCCTTGVASKNCMSPQIRWQPVEEIWK